MGDFSYGRKCKIRKKIFGITQKGSQWVKIKDCFSKVKDLKRE